MSVIVDRFVTIFRTEVQGTGRVKAELGSIEKSMNGAISAIGHNMIASSLGVAFLAKSLSQTEDQLTAIATQAKITNKQMFEYDKQLRKTAMSSGVKAIELRGAVQEFVERTGDIKTIVNQRETLANAMRGLRLNQQDAGNLLAGFWDVKLPAKDWMETIDKMAEVAKAGSIPLDKLAKVMPRAMGVAYASGNTDPKEAIPDLVAFLEVINRLTRSESRAMTAMDNFVMDYSLGAKKLSKATGIAFTGREGFVGIAKKLDEFARSGGNVSNALAQVTGEAMKSGDEMRNLFTELRGSYGRRGARAATAVMMFGDAFESLREKARGAKNVSLHDKLQQNQSFSQSLHSLGTSLEDVKVKLIESGGLIEAFRLLSDSVATVANVFKAIPAPIMQALSTYIVFSTFIRGAVLFAVRGLTFAMTRMITKFRTLPLLKTGIVKFFGSFFVLASRGRSLTDRWRISWRMLNMTIKSNPIIAIVTAVIDLVYWLSLAWGFLKLIIKGKEDSKSITEKDINSQMQDYGTAMKNGLTPAYATGGVAQTNVTNIYVDGHKAPQDVAIGIESALEESGYMMGASYG